MNKNQPTSKGFNIQEADQPITKGEIEIVKISEDLDILKDEDGVLHDKNCLYFYVAKGGNVRYALRDAMNYLETNKDKTYAIIKYKEFETSFGRDEKFADVLNYIYAVEDIMKELAAGVTNPNFSPIQ